MKLTTEFTKINAKIGETIELKCFAEGNPKPKIIWYKVGDSQSELTKIIINLILNLILQFKFSSLTK